MKKKELLVKSKEAILSAIQIYNNPLVVFKSETFIVLTIISWTYLMHAYYKNKNIEYRYFEQKNKSKKFHRTGRGAFKYWELEKCLDEKSCPIDDQTKANLKFLIGIRHEIEHQMTGKIDEHISEKFQACILNYNDYIQKFFGEKNKIDQNLTFSLQLTSLDMDQLKPLALQDSLPKNIHTYIEDFEQNLPNNIPMDRKYQCKVFFERKLVNHKNQADKTIEFSVASDTKANSANTSVVIKEKEKEKEKQKYSPTQIVTEVQKKHPNFNMYKHTQLWYNADGKNPVYSYGVMVVKTWYWYEKWLQYVKSHCKKNKDDC
ncbi:MAG: DUF3644 domain-containing protein [Chitinophagaceae bacterium]